MTVSKIRLPDNTEHDIRAKYLIQSSSSDATSAEFSARTVTDDAIANIQKIYGNTVVVSDNLYSNSAAAILSRGFNLWDEIKELGDYSSSGGKSSNNNKVRNANKIPVVPGSTVFYKSPVDCNWYLFGADSSTVVGLWTGSGGIDFDIDHPVGTSIVWYHNTEKVIPSNCCYLAFSTFGTTYSSISLLTNFCINFSDPAKDGTYEPYNGHQIDLSIPTLTGKLNGAGSSVVIFPDGMGYDGVNRDELTGQRAIRKTKIVDMGTLTWSYSSYYTAFYCSSLPSDFKQAGSNTHIMSGRYTLLASTASDPRTDADKTIKGYNGYLGYYLVIKDSSYTSAASLKTSLSGVNLCYEINSPQEYILDNALQLQYPVVAGGTEMVLPTTGTAPMKMDVIYGNAADAAATMSQNFISVDSMKEFLAALGTQMGGTWSMGYQDGKHTFTFTT